MTVELQTPDLLKFNDLIVELQCLICPTLQLHDVGHLRVDDGQL